MAQNAAPRRTGQIGRAIGLGVAILILVLPLKAGPLDAVPLSSDDAGLLLSLLPGVAEIKAKGMGLACSDEMTGVPGLNRDAYYFRTCRMTNEPKGVASNLFGHYAVNKWTAEVWDFVLKERIDSAKLNEASARLQVAHHLDAATLHEHREAPFYK